jgi:hypothetical protein
MPTDKSRAAIIGLAMPSSFPLSAAPNAEMHLPARSELDAVGDRFGIKTRHTSYEDPLAIPTSTRYINSPIADHAAVHGAPGGQARRKHSPAATTIDECRQIVEWQRKSGRVYMMMETVVYREHSVQGVVGKDHQQDMDGDGHWEGFPHALRAHCVSPCLAILGKHAEHVVCHGSGRIDEHLIPKYGSPFAIETATFKLRDSDVCAEVTRSLFNTARQYRESFDVYGQAVVQWQRSRTEPVITPKHGTAAHQRRFRASECPTTPALPESIRRFTQPAAIQDAEHLRFSRAAGTADLIRISSTTS